MLALLTTRSIPPSPTAAPTSALRWSGSTTSPGIATSLAPGAPWRLRVHLVAPALQDPDPLVNQLRGPRPVPCVLRSRRPPVPARHLGGRTRDRVHGDVLGGRHPPAESGSHHERFVDPDARV